MAYTLLLQYEAMVNLIFCFSKFIFNPSIIFCRKPFTVKWFKCNYLIIICIYVGDYVLLHLYIIEMETQFEITTSTVAETEQIIDLILTIQQQEFNIPITATDQPDLNEIDQFYKAPGGEFWIAKDQDQVIGSIALINIGDGIGVIRKMFVHKDYRGKEKGIAQKLLDTLIAYAGAKGINAIYLGTVEKLQAAIRFYERNGFIPIEKANLPASMPLMKLDTHFFVLHQNDDK